MSKEEQGYPLARGVLLPAAAVAGGIYGGSVLGGTAAKALAETRGIQQWLRRASPQKKAKILQRIRTGMQALGGAAGAGISAGSYAALNKELKKREKARASEKTAMFLVCLEHIGELNER